MEQKLFSSIGKRHFYRLDARNIQVDEDMVVSVLVDEEVLAPVDEVVSVGEALLV
jgi:hypothetical protein